MDLLAALSKSIFRMDSSHLVAVFLVGFYAWTRFATPKTARTQTTRFQYYGSCLIYVISCIGLLMFLSGILTLKPELLGFLYFGSKEPGDLSSLDAPLVAALVLTTLLPSVPMLRDIDAAMLGFFHRMGAIPLGAVRWAQRMNMAQFTIPEKLIADTKTHIANSQLLPDSLSQELQPDFAQDGVRFRFTRALTLYVAVRNLRGWAGFAADFPEDAAAFEKRMSNFFAQSIAFFTLRGQLSQRELDPVRDWVDKFRSYSLEAYEDIRLMLARVLLYSCNGEAEVAQQLSTMGFSIQRHSPVRLPFNLLSLDVVGVVVLFAGATILLADQGQMPLGRALLIGTLVATNHSIAAVCALAPKQLWPFADFQSARERPILSYLLSGLCALTITLPLSYAFYLLRVHLHVDTQPILPFGMQAKWLLLSTVLAIALAFECDDFIEADYEPWWLKWLEGVGTAAVIAVCGLLAVLWIQVDRTEWAASHPDVVLHHVPLWIPGLLSASIGALFGATIPYWYRKTARGPIKESTKAEPPSTEKIVPAV